jgi:hypothetical protein
MNDFKNKEFFCLIFNFNYFYFMNDLKSLNSKVLNESSIEELEERLELSCWTDCSFTSYDSQYCMNPFDYCTGNYGFGE